MSGSKNSKVIRERERENEEGDEMKGEVEEMRSNAHYMHG